MSANAPHIRLPEHPLRPRRGVVGVIVQNGRFLVIRRSQLVRAPGMHCFPGGGIEEGESEPEALRREMLEELAVIARPVRRVWRSTTRWQVDLAWWLAEIESDAELKPHPAEVESAHWMTATDIRALSAVLESNLEFLDAWERGTFVLDPGAEDSLP